MKFQSKAAAMGHILSNLNNYELEDFETDNQGQLTAYLGVWRWQDGSYHDDEEPVQDIDFSAFEGTTSEELDDFIRDNSPLLPKPKA